MKSDTDLKIENQTPLTEVGIVKKEQLPNGILVDEFGSLSAAKDFKGIYIRQSPEENISRLDAKLVIDGIVGIFVNPGAAMSTWQEFPESVIVHVKDLSTGKTYDSSYLEQSISWDETPDFGPSNQIVHNRFEKNLFNAHFFSGLDQLSEELKPESKVEVYVTFEGMKSNTLSITVK